MQTPHHSNGEFLLEIKRKDYFFRPLFVAWIVFAGFKFNLNPFFFSFTIGLAVLFILAINDFLIEVRNDRLEISNVNWFPVLSGTETIYYSNISKVDFYKREVTGLAIVLNVIEY